METARVDAAERYVLLRRLEQRLRQGQPVTTRELAEELCVECRTLRRYLTVLQTAEEFRVEIIREGRSWAVLTE